MRHSTVNWQALRALCALLFAACLPLAAQDAQPLNGIAHVAFRVSDLPKSREFYKTLGWSRPSSSATIGARPLPTSR